ncbi:MAG: 3-deoxy-D-manno-octulosonic acid transferase [Planctomycetota bacterium]|jgi:3-deoxy-D-manno-octulosonic-acid transferase
MGNPPGKRDAQAVRSARRRRPGGLEPFLYDAFYTGALTVLAPSLIYKIAKGKYRQGWANKLGFVPKRDARPRIWIHAVSVGETVAAGVLAEGLAREFPDHEIVASTTTPTGQTVAKKSFGEERSFYLPLDFSGPVRRAFARTKPSLLVLMESELWPNLIAAASRAGVPVAIVNGRISDRAMVRYRRIVPLLRGTVRRVGLFACQTEEYAERYRALGAGGERVVVTGSLKYDGVRTEPDPESIRWAKEELRIAKGERVLLAGSTHRTEELAVARAWRLVRGEADSGGGREASRTWRLVVAPRHPERVPDVEAELAREGFTTVRRTRLASQPAGPLAAGTVIIVDTVGELGRFYHAADLVFVGGSLIPHGGQNPIEPAGLGLPVIFGPHMFNFTETAEALLDAGGARSVGSVEELCPAVKELARDAAARKRLGEAGRAAILSRQGARARTATLLRNLLA